MASKKTNKKTKVVDGYMAVRAASEAAKHGKADPVRPEEDGKASESAQSPPSGVGTRIGRSVMPSKREIICPDCGYAIQITGKLQLVVCQKCRARLQVKDETLTGAKCGEDGWSDEIETGGTVTITQDALLAGGSITANDIVLKGPQGNAELRACRRLFLHPGAEVDWTKTRFLDLEILEGVEIEAADKVKGRHLELHGALTGEVELEGSLTIHPTADMQGAVKASGLVVKEGGGLRAALDVNPEYAPEPEDPRPTGVPGKAKAPPGRSSAAQRKKPEPPRGKK